MELGVSLKKILIALLVTALIGVHPSSSQAAVYYDVIQISQENITLETTTFASTANHKVRLRASIFFSPLMTSVSQGFSQVCFTNNGTRLVAIGYNQGSGVWNPETGCIVARDANVFGGLTTIDISFPLSSFVIGSNAISMDVISPESVPLSIGGDNKYSITLSLPNHSRAGQCSPVGARSGNANVGDILSVSSEGIIGVTWAWAGADIRPTANTRLTVLPTMKFFDVYPHCELLATAQLENGVTLRTDSFSHPLGELIIVGQKTFITEPPIFFYRGSSIKNLKKWTYRKIVLESLSIGWTAPSSIKVRSKQLGKWSTWKTVHGNGGAFVVPLWIKGSVQFEIRFNDENGTNRRFPKLLKVK